MTAFSRHAYVQMLRWRVRKLDECLSSFPAAAAAASSARLVVHRSYYTNGDRVKREDPFAALGLSWGATVSDIKAAYRKRSLELHPDVTDEEPAVALAKFQEIQRAYSRLLDAKNNIQRDDVNEEFSFQVWRSGDVIAQERRDVAGALRKRPVKPAGVEKMTHFGMVLGQPDGSGVRRGRGEYLGDGGGVRGAVRSGTVGTGRNKWRTPPEFKPWTPDESNMVRAKPQRNSSVKVDSDQS